MKSRLFTFGNYRIRSKIFSQKCYKERNENAGSYFLRSLFGMKFKISRSLLNLIQISFKKARISWLVGKTYLETFFKKLLSLGPTDGAVYGNLDRRGTYCDGNCILLFNGLEHTGKKLLEARIKGCFSKISFLSAKVKSLIGIITLHTPSDITTKLIQEITSKMNLQNTSTALKHEKKIDHWKKKYHFPGDNHCIVNLSDYELSPSEISLLNKGLSYRPIKNVFLPQIISSIESGIHNISNNNMHMIRNFVASTLAPTPSNRTSQHNKESHRRINKEILILNNLSKNKNITISRADKGGSVVILNTEDYINRMKTHLNNTEFFVKIEPQEASKSITAFKKSIHQLLKNQIIDQSLKKQILENPGTHPYIYGLPKIHKENTPLRPIVAYNQSPAYSLSKHLANRLSDITKNLPHIVKNPEEILQKMKNFKLEANHRIVSYDVKDLYTSLPHDLIMDSLQTILIKHKEAYPDHLSILKLTEICLKSTTVKFTGEYYNQIKGTPMGSPLSTILAEIVLSTIDSWITEVKPNEILIWSRNRTGFTTKVYRKPTSPTQYLHFASNSPISHKITVVRTLTKRAFTHCSSKIEYNKELNFIENQLLKSGYPLPFIKRNRYKPGTPRNNSNQYISTCYLPYTESTITIARKLKSFGIKTIFRGSPSMASILRNPITKSTDQKQKKDLVYQIPCLNCNSVYIGETSRDLSIRIKEHQRNISKLNPNSLIVDHVRETGHTPDFNNTRILHSNAKTKTQRLILEAIETMKHPKPLNKKRFESYCIANDIVKIVKKKATFFSLCGRETYNIIRTLTSPKNPLETEWEEIVAGIKKYFDPTPNIIVQRFKFAKRLQMPNETISEFITALKKIAEKCEFPDVEDRLRDALVCGILSEEIQSMLLMNSMLTFKVAQEMALAHEAAVRNVAEIKDGKPQEEINVMGRAVKVRRRNEKIFKCFRCGYTNHREEQCFFKEKRCFKCQKLGGIYLGSVRTGTGGAIVIIAR
ncbi:hypothetical protein LAZ67_3002762 [Cordylochernes scorpioides]|uniref:Reverse transcriptase domain-containing protein n=1 Tax=Cordylochernes scorpioides TaxID=51811 RepID=A0ABY6K9G3_9ARAC|nr:hypothetical protein LAZ67_3002762 [Cordylochernes scorpioides]